MIGGDVMVKGIRCLLILAIIGMMGCSTIPVNQGSRGDLEGRVESLEQQVQILMSSGVGAATQIYARDCTGASGDDSCSTKNMADISTASAGDKCLVLDTARGIKLTYQYVASGVTEAYPWEVDDDNDVGSAGWILMEWNGNGILTFGYIDPENLPTDTGRSENLALVWCNYTGLTYNIDGIYAKSDADYDFELYITNSGTDFSAANDSPVKDATVFDVSSAGTGMYYNSWTSFDDSTVANGQCILFVHDAGTANYVYGWIVGHLS